MSATLWISRAGLLCIACMGVPALGARAQVPVSPQSGCAREPEIVVSGTAGITVAPAKAGFTIEIKTSAANAGLTTSAVMRAESVRVMAVPVSERRCCSF